MRFYLFLLFIAFSQYSQAKGRSLILHDILEELTAKLLQQQQLQQRDGTVLITNADYTYIHQLGGIIVLEHIESLSEWFTNSQEMTYSSLMSKNYGKARATFNEVRLQAKHLSHQIYALERKLKSLKQAQGTSDNSAMILSQIKEAEQQLAGLMTEKIELKPVYDNAEQQLAIEKKGGEDYVLQYLHRFEKQLYNHVCRNEELLALYDEQSKESLSFILKQAGKHITRGNQDIIYRISPDVLTACKNNIATDSSFNALLINHAF